MLNPARLDKRFNGLLWGTIAVVVIIALAVLHDPNWLVAFPTAAVLILFYRFIRYSKEAKIRTRKIVDELS